MCEVCRFEPPSHAPWCPAKDQDALREMSRKKAEMEENTKLRSDAISNFQRIAELEAENKRRRQERDEARAWVIKLSTDYGCICGKCGACRAWEVAKNWGGGE